MWGWSGGQQGGTGQQRRLPCLAIHVKFLIMRLLFSKNVLDEVEQCFGCEEDVGYCSGGVGEMGRMSLFIESVFFMPI